MIRQIIIVAILLAVAAACRFWIFRLQDKDIAPEFYDRKLKLEDFWLPDRSAPSGFKLTPTLPGGNENPSIIDASVLPSIPKARVQFPAPERIVKVHAACYASALGDQVLLIAAQPRRHQRNQSGAQEGGAQRQPGQQQGKQGHHVVRHAPLAFASLGAQADEQRHQRSGQGTGGDRGQ